METVYLDNALYGKTVTTKYILQGEQWAAIAAERGGIPTLRISTSKVRKDLVTRFSVTFLTPEGSETYILCQDYAHAYSTPCARVTKMALLVVHNQVMDSKLKAEMQLVLQHYGFI